MKSKNFYLIDSPKINELTQTEKDLLEKQLTIYHTHSSSIIDKAKAIEVLVAKGGITKLQYEYNDWLYNFVNYHLKSNITESEKNSLERILGACYHLFGYKSSNKGNFQEALNSYKKAIHIYTRQKYKRGLFIIYHSIAILYYDKGDQTIALEFYDKAANLSRALTDKTNLAIFYNDMAFVLKDQGNFSKALDYLYKALRIYEENNDELGIAISYHSIGLSLVSQNELDEALKYFLAALKLYKKNGDEDNESFLNIEIGQVYQENNKYDIALKYYIKASKNNKLSKIVGKAYLKMGTIYENQKHIDLAHDYYNKSLQIIEKIDSKQSLSEVMCKIGALKIKTGEIEKASEYIENAFALAQALKYPVLIIDAASAKVQLAVKKGDFELAYKMQKLKNEMKEKIQNESISKEIIRQQLKYEYEKQLKKKGDELELERQNSQRLQEQIDLLSAKNMQLASKAKFINEQLLEKDNLIQKLREEDKGINKAV